MDDDMNKENNSTFLFWLLGVFFLFLMLLIFYLRYDPKSPDAHKTLTHNGITYLGQGWGIKERDELSYTSFGSRIIDYEWFLVLENASNQQLFRQDENLARLGFLIEPSNEFNPDGLPIGITRDSDANGNSWMGLTCAACHTSESIINGQAVRIDGGQSLINYTQLEVEILAALTATLAQPEKWQRFLTRLESKESSLDANTLKQQLTKRVAELTNRFAINATQVPYGHGRLDAFGQIFNTIAAEALGVAENRRSPDAPTSFPVLWDASHLDLVQWNLSAPNKEPGPLAQNAVTALGVYGTVEILAHNHTYSSSINIKNLGYIQKKFYKLVSPKWPENMAGKLDRELLGQGEKIYKKECLECHQMVDSTDPTRKIMSVAVLAKSIGTDPRMVDNFNDETVKTGELEGKHFALWFGKKFTTEATRLEVVLHVVLAALLHHPWDSLISIVKEFRNNKSQELDSKVKYYKARPINGIWTSAPYLHNGSIPTVYDLLLPASQRPSHFYVGNRQLDTIKVGNKSEFLENSSLFDTTLAGNSNAGHEYGTQLEEADRKALLEYIKSL
jgi:hypothetical protein